MAPRSELQDGRSDPLGSTRAVGRAIRDLAAGRTMVLTDEAAAEAQLVAAAQHLEVETYELFLTRTRGVALLAMSPDRVIALGLRHLGAPDSETQHLAPVDLFGHDRPGSPADRVATIHALAAPEAAGTDLVSPGLIFPVEAAADGCLGGAGAVDACYDLGLLGGSEAALCADLAAEHVPSEEERRAGYSRELGAIVTRRQLILYRERGSQATRRAVSAGLPTRLGELAVVGYESERGDDEYIAFVRGELSRPALPVYVHARCLVSDVFGGLHCGCGERLQRALEYVHLADDGLVLYADHDRGKHLGHLHPMTRPRRGGLREREIACVLRDLGVRSIVLTANTFLDRGFLEDLGIVVISDDSSDSKRHETHAGRAG